MRTYQNLRFACSVFLFLFAVHLFFTISMNVHAQEGDPSFFSEYAEIVSVGGLVVGIVGTFFGLVSLLASKKTQKHNRELIDNLGRHDEKEEQSREKIKQLYSEQEEIERQRDLLTKKLPVSINHLIIFDGGTGAGKSSIIARLANPVVSEEQIRNMVATSQEYATVPVPVVWGDRNNRQEIHEIKFHDCAGEYPRSFMNTLIKIRDEAQKKGSRTPDAVLAIIWDLTEEKCDNRAHLNEQRLDGTYGNDIALDLIKSVVVFLNKIDEIPKRQLNKKTEDAKAYIDNVFKKLFEDGFGEIEYYQGSAIVGNGLHEFYASLLRKLKLDDKFVPVTGHHTFDR